MDNTNRTLWFIVFLMIVVIVTLALLIALRSYINNEEGIHRPIPMRCIGMRNDSGTPIPFDSTCLTENAMYAATTTARAKYPEWWPFGH